MTTQHNFPAVFVSHGAPDILLSRNAAVEAMQQLVALLPAPVAIVVISAHWIEQPVKITNAAKLDTIHDFGGFPAQLYAKRYPASGDATVSTRIQQLLTQHGIDCKLDPRRGLDHGAWIPLIIMYPQANIPVIQVSLPAGSLHDLVTLGEALSPLRKEGVLIIGSGGSVHNLRALNRAGKTEAWASEFEQWLLTVIEGNQFDHLINPEHFPPTIGQAHPTLEHYAPLIVAWAAADRHQPGRRQHHSFDYGNIGMSHYLFGA
ncbi:MAG: dioxygenase [Gammaproteobacteria bacterium]|nr:dioxygenase [Gammaproteobacteria bacterium]MBL6998312.1 dioxygenase [Gammaproteobacteria bacterium]